MFARRSGATARIATSIPVAQSIATRDAVLAACEARHVVLMRGYRRGTAHRGSPGGILRDSALRCRRCNSDPARQPRAGRSRRSAAASTMCSRAARAWRIAASTRRRCWRPSTWRGPRQKRTGRGLRRATCAGIAEQAPAVITLNMRAASACVMEFIARAFPFPSFAQPPATPARPSCWRTATRSMRARRPFVRSESPPNRSGLQEPLLGLPALGAEDAMMRRAPIWWRGLLAALSPARSLRIVEGDTLPAKLPWRNVVLARDGGEDWSVSPSTIRSDRAGLRAASRPRHHIGARLIIASSVPRAGTRARSCRPAPTPKASLRRRTSLRSHAPRRHPPA